MGRSSVELDEVGDLLQAAGCGDADAFAAFYDRTASVVFGVLHHALGEAAAERATVWVYVRVWRTAHTFDPAVLAGGAFLILIIHREIDGRDRRDDARCAGADHSDTDRLGVSSRLRG